MKKTAILLSVVLCFSLEAVTLKRGKKWSPLKRQEAEKIVEDVYSQIDQSPYSIKSEEIDVIRKEGGDSTYGEITYDSVQQLIDHAKLTAKDTFYDFGCGRGRACLQIALETPAKVVGVDLSTTRIDMANKAKEILKNKHNIDLGNRLTYRNESFIKTPLAKNPVIYACATCFPENLMKEIGNKIAAHKGGARLYTLKQISGWKTNADLTWSMSWNSSTACYYYDTRSKKSMRQKLSLK